jgi:hypothetical protein
MHTNVTLPTTVGGPQAPTVEACADVLRSAVAAVAAHDQQVRDLVRLVWTALDTLAAEAIEQTSLDELLAVSGLPRTDPRSSSTWTWPTSPTPTRR